MLAIPTLIQRTTRMVNPYAPAADSTILRPISGPSITLVKRIVCFLCFSCGCILGVHLVVAFQSRPAEAIQRTVSDPVHASLFFATGVAACFAATTAWRASRRWLFADYTSVPVTRFAAGLLLVVLYVLVGELLMEIARRVEVPRSVLGADHLPLPGMILQLFLAAVLTIELEAIVVRLLPCQSGRSSEGPYGRDQGTGLTIP